MFTADEPEVNISYEITGVPGATGTVTTLIYSENPNPIATIPYGIGLTHYVVVTFNMEQSDFLKAVIVISYTDADVEGLMLPAVYKHIPESNIFVELTTDIDADAKTMTIIARATQLSLFLRLFNKKRQFLC